MSTLIDPLTLLILLTPLFILLAISLFALTLTRLRSPQYPDLEDDDTASIIHPETKPLLSSKPHNKNHGYGYRYEYDDDDESHQDPLKDYPYGKGKSVTGRVSAKRARKQEVNRAVLRELLEREWRGSAFSSYGGVVSGGKGPRVGEKRKKVGLEGRGRGKRARVEDGEEGDDEASEC